MDVWPPYGRPPFGESQPWGNLPFGNSPGRLQADLLKVGQAQGPIGPFKGISRENRREKSKIQEKSYFCTIGQLGGPGRAQNTPMGSGNIFHTRQTHLGKIIFGKF